MKTTTKAEGPRRGEGGEGEAAVKIAEPGRQGMEVAPEFAQLVAEISHHAIVLPDGTRIVLGHVQTYRPMERWSIEFRLAAVSHAVVAAFGSATEQKAALAWLDQRFAAVSSQ